MLQRQCRRYFKKCRMRIPIANAFTDFGETARDFVWGNHLAIYADAFAKTDEVRGGEQGRPVTGSTRNRIDESADGAFAVCPGDVNDATRRERWRAAIASTRA